MNIAKALDALPLERDDVVFCHSNLGFFGRIDGDTCRRFAEEILKRVATLIVPTFSYSFANEEIFDPTKPSKMGIFSEWVRCHGTRSHDPFYSVAVIGDDADYFTQQSCLCTNSFDENSFFAKFAARGKILNLNCNAGSTFIHFVERTMRVPYRFDKTFAGLIKDGESLIPTAWTIWVRHLADSTVAAFHKFDAAARHEGLFKTAPLGRGEIGVISASDTTDLIRRKLPTNPWFLTVGR